MLRHLERIGRRFDRPVLTLGNFDGVHRGHQAILHRVIEYARQTGGDALALTFEPHPISILAPERAPELLTDWRSRVERIAEYGVGNVIVQRFTPAFARISAEDFLEHLLWRGLGVQALIVGHRVRFGHNRRGDAELLHRFAQTRGIDVEIVGPIEVAGELVSSSMIRSAIRAGELDRARRLLGRPHMVSGRVIQGHHRGRNLGFPTANLRYGRLVLPPDGVYAVRVRRHDKWFDGVANIGRNPTFGDRQRSFEVYVLDFDEEIYGERLEVSLEHQLRGEIRFDDPEALVSQIHADVEAARQLLRQAWEM